MISVFLRTFSQFVISINSSVPKKHFSILSFTMCHWNSGLEEMQLIFACGLKHVVLTSSRMSSNGPNAANLFKRQREDPWCKACTPAYGGSLSYLSLVFEACTKLSTFWEKLKASEIIDLIWNETLPCNLVAAHHIGMSCMAQVFTCGKLCLQEECSLAMWIVWVIAGIVLLTLIRT